MIDTVEKMDEKSQEFEELVNGLEIKLDKPNKKDVIKYLLVMNPLSRGVAASAPIWMATMLYSMVLTVLGRSVAMGSLNLIGGKILTAVMGPVGLIAGGLYTVYDVAGPAYRVIIPATIQIAYLRLKYKHQNQ